MAFAHITSLLNTIQFHFLQPSPCFIFYDRQMMEYLCEKIRFLQAFLEDSEKNSDVSRVLEIEIRDVAGDAETKIESELHHLYLRYSEVHLPIIPPPSLYQTLKQVKRKIESIERRIIQIESNNSRSVEPQRSKAMENIKAGSFSQRSSEPKNVMVGCEDEFDTIKNKLISNSEKLEVISVVGMGGIGKTTLIRRIYEDSTIISHFDIRAWATVSQKHNLREMLIALLGSSNVTNGVDNHHLANQLRQKLMGQRYLIVMDDIWGTQAWDDIYRCFPEEDFNGSRILLTTRLKQVADYASPGKNSHYMRFLNCVESWDLFYKKVFEDKKVSHEFETIGRGIVEKCQGLPLTIIVVAGLLTSFNKPSLTQWGNIVENLNSFLNTDPEEKCSKVLSLSYDHLPLHLKVCFLYFGVFPEDSMIHVKKLISLWIAEGFLKLELNNNMEQVGETYLHDLVDRGLVQIVKWSFDGKIKSCRLHDLLHNFCLREAQRESLLDVINEKTVLDVIDENNAGGARVKKSLVHKLATKLPKCLAPKGWIQNLGSKNHMLMSTGLDRKPCRWISNHFDSRIFHTSKEFRSILYFPKADSRFLPNNSSQTFPIYPQLLRVLDISVCELVDIPSEIVNLIHLRYLALKTNASLKDYQWVKLQSLQTFIVEIIGPKVLGEVWKSPIGILDDMPRLRHVMFSRSSLYFPRWCRKHLQTISCLYLSAQHWKSMPNFRNIPNVKKLGIYIDINHVSEPNQLLYDDGFLPNSWLDGLDELCQLENLKINVPQIINFQDVFRLPAVFSTNLKKLTLRGTCLPWEDMAIIATLPNLEALKLKQNACCGTEWKTTENGFYKLKYLKIVVSNLERWDAHFPVLECLILDFCRKLKRFPIGFADITTLQLIELTRCGSSLVTSAKQIQKEQLECFGHDKLVVRDYCTLP